MPANQRLLIVDDERGVSRVIEIAAAALGIQALAINDTDQFEKAFESIRPTIIFLDIAMPGRDGVELIGQLAAQNYTGQVVVMSGSDPHYIQMGSAIAKARGLNLVGSLPKPFRKQQVVDLLTELAGKHGGLTNYRCFFLSANSFAAVEIIRSESDTAAIAKASELLANSAFSAAEVWTGARCVGSVTKKG